MQFPQRHPVDILPLLPSRAAANDPMALLAAWRAAGGGVIPAPDSIIAAYSFDIGTTSGDDITDTTGNGHALTRTAGTLETTGGRSGGYLKADATSGDIGAECAADDNWFDPDVAGFSISVWARLGASPPDVSTLWDHADQYGSASLAIRVDGSVRFHAAQPTHHSRIVSTAAAVVAPSTWHHVCATWAPSDYMRIYVDGVEEASLNTFAEDLYPFSPDTLIKVGENADGSTPFRGSIDAFRCYGLALTAAQVAQLAIEFPPV